VLASSLDLRTALQVFDGLKKAMQSICLDTELHMLYLVIIFEKKFFKFI